MYKLAATMLIASHLLFALPAQAQEWVSSGESDGIRLYTKVEPGRTYSSFRATVRVKASMKQVLAVLLERERFPEWFDQMREDITLENDNPDYSYCYIRMKGIWPAADRDVVARVTVTQDPDTSAVSITARSTEPERVPLRKDRVRMPYMYSVLKALPISATETEVEIEGTGDLAGNVPSFVADIVTSTMPRKSLTNIRRKLESPSGVDLSVLDRVPFAVLSMQKIKLPQF